MVELLVAIPSWKEHNTTTHTMTLAVCPFDYTGKINRPIHKLLHAHGQVPDLP